jgi:small subunit ribosomal protein S2
MPYVTERWMGGTLTNWSTIHARVQEMERLEKMRDNNELQHLTKKEGLLIGREIIRLQTRLEGLRTMKRRPDLIFIIDIGREDSAVREANLLNIPIVALVDTNCNPQNIDYVIPSNDDAIRAIKLLVAKVADAVLEGKAMRKEEDLDEREAAAEAADDKSARKPARKVELEDELDEEDLLGEATLAKLNVSREDEGGDENKVEEEAEEVEEVKEVEEVEEKNEESDEESTEEEKPEEERAEQEKPESAE